VIPQNAFYNKSIIIKEHFICSIIRAWMHVPYCCKDYFKAFITKEDSNFSACMYIIANRSQRLNYFICTTVHIQIW
jgi:hypothetical protein